VALILLLHCGVDYKFGSLNEEHACPEQAQLWHLERNEVTMMGVNGTNGVEVEGGQGGGKVVYGDGSWQLTVFVTDLQVERNLRVRGDLHIGGVMIKLVDSLGK
jgi:hypothetical protein